MVWHVHFQTGDGDANKSNGVFLPVLHIIFSYLHFITYSIRHTILLNDNCDASHCIKSNLLKKKLKTILKETTTNNKQ